MTERRLANAAAAALALLFVALATISNARTSATWDEPAYLGQGLSILATRDYRLHADAPPLPSVLGALAARTLSPALPLDDPSWAKADEWAFARELVNVRNRPIATALVFRGRLPIAALGGLGVLVVFLWTRELAGDRAGLAAALLAALSPDWLAHSAVLSCDVAASTFMAATVAYATFLPRRGPGALGWREALALGALAFLALASKFTALALGLVLPATVLGAALLRRRAGQETATLAELGKLLLRAGVVALGLVTLVLYPGELGLAKYLTGLSSVYRNIDPDVRFFFLGEYATHGWPTYALASVLLKETLGALALATAGVVVSVRAARGRGELLGPLVLAGVVLAGSLGDPAAFGLRRVLPALPPLFVLGGVGAGAALDGLGASRRGRAVAGTAVVLLLAHAASSLASFPACIPYVNEAARLLGDRTDLFTDSNVDWGEALPDLARELEARKPARVKLAYYGTIDPALYGVHGDPITRDDLEHPRAGVLYAISASRLVEYRGLVRAGRLRPEADWLSRARPVARAGDAIYLYEGPGLLGAGPRR